MSTTLRPHPALQPAARPGVPATLCVTTNIQFTTHTLFGGCADQLWVCCVHVCAGVPLGYANDHGTYMGIDVNNGQCAVDQSVYNAGRTSDRTECASV